MEDDNPIDEYGYPIYGAFSKKVMNHQTIKPDEKVCNNCKYRLWLVGLGLGVRCGYGHYVGNDDNIKPQIPIIPHLRHTCDKFEFRREENEK